MGYQRYVHYKNLVECFMTKIKKYDDKIILKESISLPRIVTVIIPMILTV